MLGANAFYAVGLVECHVLHQGFLEDSGPCNGVVLTGELTDVAVAVAENLVRNANFNGVALRIVHRYGVGVV